MNGHSVLGMRFLIGQVLLCKLLSLLQVINRMAGKVVPNTIITIKFKFQNHQEPNLNPNKFLSKPNQLRNTKLDKLLKVTKLHKND